MAQTSSWKDLAQKKRNAILNSIPAKWRVEQSKLPSNEEQRDVTGYIQQFLSEREVEITEKDVVGIAKETSTGNWTAAEVAEAFCHRASLAHQLVSCKPAAFYILHAFHLMFLQKGQRVRRLSADQHTFAIS
jgi:amidase